MAGVVVDPERLLWRPGAKTIFLPPAPRIFTSADIFPVGSTFTIHGDPRVFTVTGHHTGVVTVDRAPSKTPNSGTEMRFNTRPVYGSAS